MNNIDSILTTLQDYVPCTWMENSLYHPDGYEQKLKLRPAQVEIINEIYSPHRWFAYSLGRQSGKTVTICSIALHRAIVLKRRVVIVAPSEKNMNIIWDKMKALLKYNEKLSSQIERDRQKPAKELKFEEGGWISGAITGVSPSKELVGNRGNSCDDIIVDEASYIPDTAWKVILPYLINTPDGKLILTSTPSPYEDYFFRVFHPEKLTEEEKALGFTFKTRAYTAPMANPNWNAQTEGMFKVMLTPEEYDREILVQFPKEAGGVFSQSQVEESLADYAYSNEKISGWRYVFGVDWNQSENGGQIAILGFNDTSFYLANRIVVSNVTNPQTATIQRIIELNDIWNPEYIFIDAGYGNTQNEFLHNYGIRNPKTKLHVKTKAIDFNTDETIRIIVNGEKIKKKPKPFMVGLMQRAFQDRLFKFSKYDVEGKTSLYMQFRNFRIKKQSFGSVPVYDDGYYHSIIAVMICFIGIYKFYSKYSEDYIGNTNGYIVPFDRDKIEGSVFYTPENIKNINKPFSSKESREHDPKWKEFISVNIGQKKNVVGGSGYSRRGIGPLRPRSNMPLKRGL